jgi:hypothetical protein
MAITGIVYYAIAIVTFFVIIWFPHWLRDQGRRIGFKGGGTSSRAKRAKKNFLTPPPLAHLEGT